jgi:hypothetical protein
MVGAGRGGNGEDRALDAEWTKKLVVRPLVLTRCYPYTLAEP